MLLEQILNFTITIFALIATILAWFAKIKWSREFKDAKNAEIKAKEAQMDSIREKNKLYESIISNKLIDYSKKTIEELEVLINEIEESKQDELNKILKKLNEIEQKYKKEKSRVENIPALLKKLNEIEQKYKKEKSRVENIPALSDVFHELRLPINAILGFSNLIIEDDLSQEDKQEYIKIITDNCDRVSSIVDDIVQYSMTIEQEKL